MIYGPYVYDWNNKWKSSWFAKDILHTYNILYTFENKLM